MNNKKEKSTAHISQKSSTFAADLEQLMKLRQMKKNVFLMAMIAIALVGCKDSADVRSAAGTYSYKTAGTVLIDTVTSLAFTEQGALDVLSLKSGDSIYLTFNELFGDVYSTRGCIHGGEVTLCPFTRRFSHAQILNPIAIEVTGAGHIYDGSIVLQLNYHSLPTDTAHILSAEEVQLIAKKN